MEERNQWLDFRLGLLLRREIPWNLKLTLADCARSAARSKSAQPGPERCARAIAAALLQQPPKVRRRVRRALDTAVGDVERELRRAEDADVDILLPEDGDFPRSLLDLPQPPVLLYVRRSAAAVSCDHAIGIVGPRNADPYGLDTARSFASDFAAAGVCVVSGFARGVDIASHRATFHLGPTWAALGCGLDVAYPRQHHRDADRIVEHGGWVLSEFPLGESPQPWHFPLRNRLIAALSDCLLVVQASERSGSLITAHAALELGRDVWAVPGRIDHTRSRGSNLLLRDGAGVALEARDLLETLLPRDPASTAHEDAARASATPDAPVGLSPAAAQVHERLRQGPCDLEALQRSVAEPVAILFAALGELELEGHIQRRPGGVFGLRAAR